MRTSSLARSHLLRFHHSSCCCSSIGCRRALSYLLSTDSGQSPQQQLHEARLSSSSHKNSTFFNYRQWHGLFSATNSFHSHISSSLVSPDVYYNHPYFWRSSFSRNFFTRAKPIQKIEFINQQSQQVVTTALWCNFFVFSLKFGVWLFTPSHVMLAEVVHSVADFANQALLAYGLSISRRPDALHRYDYARDRFVWPLISASTFSIGFAVTISLGFHYLWTSLPPDNIQYAALVIGGSFIIEGVSLVVAIQAVKKCAAAEGMKLRDYIWWGHDSTSVLVMAENGAALIGLIIAGASLVAVNITGNAIYDPIGSIVVSILLGMMAIFLMQRNRPALIGRAMYDHDVEKVLHFLKNDTVVNSLHDCKSVVIGPGFYQFEAEIDFKRVVVLQNYLKELSRQLREAVKNKDETAILKFMPIYEKEACNALRSEVHRLQKEIQELVPGIRHVYIKARDSQGLFP